MFKKGFTLAEVLVSLSIVGVVAAISAPAISNLLPDKDKLAVLKAYKSLNDATQELVNDPGYYINFSGNNANCVGLACTAQPISILSEVIDNVPTNISGDAKFAHLLARYFNGETTREGRFNRATGTGTTGVLTFTTNDQVVWQVMKSGSDHFVSIDVNGVDVGSECFYGEDDCKKPDRFQFLVTREGNIIGNDALTRAYLQSRTNTKNRANDIENAKGIAKEENLNTRPWAD